MIKRVNSTGRRRITTDQVQIEVHDDHDPKTFNATIDLKGFDAPPDAAVVIEAMCAGSNSVSRFEWGTIADLMAPSDRRLVGSVGKSVFFNLKIIDRTQRFGRILGLAENIRPILSSTRKGAGRRGILPIESRSLGQQIWQLGFEPEYVVLYVNCDIPQLSERIHSDPLVYGLIYPSIIAQILSRALEQQPNLSEDDGSTCWARHWLKFGSALHPEKKPAPESLEFEEVEEWIQDVIDAFSDRYRLCERFIRSLSNSDTWENS
jgi:hypothetical protein